MSVEGALLAAFEARLGPVHTLDHHVVPWCSATFSGARHVFRIATQETADIDAFARNIAEVDIFVPRGFVADIADIAVIRLANANNRQIDVEALTIDA